VSSRGFNAFEEMLRKAIQVHCVPLLQRIRDDITELRREIVNLPRSIADYLATTGLGERVIDLRLAAGVEHVKFEPELECSIRYIFHARCGFELTRVDKPRENARLWHEPMKLVQSFRFEDLGEIADPGNVAAGAIDACNEIDPNRVAAGKRCDWYCWGHGLTVAASAGAMPPVV
jgi:hypothetical protein